MAVPGDRICSLTPSSTSRNAASYVRFTIVLGSLLMEVQPTGKKTERTAGPQGFMGEEKATFE